MKSQGELKMIEIKEGQKLEVNNLLSFRGKVRQDEIEKIGKDMESYVGRMGAKKVGNPITATFLVDNDLIDFEILIPIDISIESSQKYTFKERLLISNALNVNCTGNFNRMQHVFNELNEYILIHKLKTITVAYSVIKNANTDNLDKMENCIYIGIDPNVL